MAIWAAYSFYGLPCLPRLLLVGPSPPEDNRVSWRPLGGGPQTWLESQLCLVTAPPVEKGLQLPPHSGGHPASHRAVGHVSIMRRRAGPRETQHGHASFFPA